MTKDEARKVIVERKSLADRVLRSSSSLHQAEALVAMGAREMADWLIGILDGETPWR